MLGRALLLVHSIMPKWLLHAALLLSLSSIASADDSCCARKARLAKLRYIPDANDTPPDVDSAGRPRLIPNPAEVRPDAWDDEDDGPWEPSSIANPTFAWKPRMVENPDYNPPTFLDDLLSEIRKATPWVLMGLLVTVLLQVAGLPLHKLAELLRGAGTLGGALIGLATPLCSCGALPVAAGFVSSGVPLNAVVAFLTASQSAGLDSAAITWGLLGPLATLCRLGGAVVLATAAGIAAGPGAGSAARKASADEQREKREQLKVGDRVSVYYDATRAGPGERVGYYIGSVLEIKRKWVVVAYDDEDEPVEEKKGDVLIGELDYDEEASRGGPRKPLAVALYEAVVGSAADTFPPVLMGLALSTAVLHVAPALASPYDTSSYDGLSEGDTGTGWVRNLSVRAAVLASSVPLQLCEHSTVTLAAGIQKGGGGAGLAFAFLLAAPAVNLPSLLLLLSAGDARAPHRRMAAVRVALTLVGAALALSYAVDAAELDLLVEQEAKIDGATSMHLPPALVRASPWVTGFIAATALVHALAKRMRAPKADECCAAGNECAAGVSKKKD